MRQLPTGTVTFLFTDIEGSTTLLQRLGDRRYAEVLAEHQRLLRDAFVEGHGQEVDTQGDAFLVAFPRARDAVGAAVAAQRTLTGHAWPDSASLRVRMGLHTGEPICDKTGYVGIDVRRAARIAAVGHGGQILLSETVALLTVLLGAAEAHREAGGTPLPFAHRSDYDRPVATIRAGLKEEAFAAAWAEGRAMTLEQAIDYALSEAQGTGRKSAPR